MQMKVSLLAAALCGVLSGQAFADHETIKPKAYDSLGKCVKAALSKHDGKIVKLEAKSERKQLVYEFDVQSNDGKAWDIECPL